MAADVFQLIGKIAIDTTDANNALQNTVTEGNTTEASLKKAFKKISGYVATYFTVKGIVDFGKSITNLATDAETAAAKVKTLLSTGTDTEQYYKEIMEASSATGIAMADYSEAVYQALSASVDQADAIGFVANATDLARGGFTDITTAVDILTTAMNAYGLTAEDATHISDVLLTTQNLGKTTVDELAQSMGRLIPTANSYGVSIEQLGASYSVLTANGIATSEATTYLRSMMKEMADDTSGIGIAIGQITGRSFGELMSAGVSIAEVLDMIFQSKALGNTETFANLWGSVEAGGAALALVNAGVEKYNTNLDAMFNTQGAAADAAETMSDTYNVQSQRLQTMLQNFGIQAGNALLPTLVSLMDKLQPMLETTVPKLVTLFENIIAAMQPLIDLLTPIIDVLLTVVGFVVDQLSGIIGWISRLFGIGSANAEASDGDAIPIAKQMAGRYAETDDATKNAIRDYIYNMMSGYDADTEFTKLLAAGVEDADSIAADISQAIAEGINLNDVESWFSPKTEEDINAELDAMNIQTEVDVTLSDGSAAQLESELAALGLSLPASLGGSDGEPHANGLDFVSRDGMLARLHYGEAVLNRTDAKAWRDGSGTGSMAALGDKIDLLISAVTAGFSQKQQIVLDSGVLVGSTVGMIDSQLGTIAGRRGRGN